MQTHWIKQHILVVIAALQFITPSFSYANKGTMITNFINGGKNALSFSGATYGKGAATKLVLSAIDDAGRVTGSLGFERASSQALYSLRPSNLSYEIKKATQNMLSKAELESAEAAERAWRAHARRSKATQAEKDAFIAEHKRNSSFRATMVNTVKRFPMEAFSFYLIIGAFQAMNLTFNYAENPLAMQQHNQAQADPVGQVGFFSFMMAAGASGYALQRMTTKKALMPYIPYMSMSIGMIASNIVHEIGHFPGLVKCLASLKIAKAACDEAYKHWTTQYNVVEKLHEWAPGLMSLVASTFIAGYLQTKGVPWVALQLGKSQILKAVALNVAISITPVGGFGRVTQVSFKFAGHLVKLAAFVGIDLYFTAPLFNVLYKNVRDGRHFDRLESQWVAHFLEQPFEAWSKTKGIRGQKTCKARNGKVLHSTFHENKDCVPELISLLEQTRKHFIKWNEFNLEKSLMAHQNWLSHVTNITLQYGQSQQFYANFVNSVYQNLYRNKYGFPQILARQLPLNGINPTNLGEHLQGKHVDDIGAVELQQLETIKAVLQASNWTQKVASYASNGFKKEPVNLYFLKESNPGVIANPEKIIESIFFEEIVRDLNLANKPLEEQLETDMVAIGKALDRMNLALTYWRYFSKPFVSLLKGLRVALGNPAPIWTPGLGYAILWGQHADRSAAIKATPFKVFNGPNSQAIYTPTFAENMMLQMVQGPSADENLIGGWFRNFGYPVSFKPPRIALDESVDLDIPHAAHAKVDGGARSTKIFFIPVTTTRDGVDKNFKNVFEYLIQGNISREIISGVSSNPALNTEASVKNNFASWWEKKVFPQYLGTWKRFETKYIPIMQDLLYSLTGEGAAWYDVLGLINSEGDRAFNAGTVSNRVGTALQQEVKLYLLLLGQMTKDLFRAQYNSAVPKMLLATKAGNPQSVPRFASVGETSVDPIYDMKQAFFENCQASKLHTHSHCFERAENFRLIYNTGLFRILGETNFLDFSTYARKVSPDVGAEITSAPMLRNLAFQENIMRVMGELLAMSKQVKIDGDKIVSSVKNKTINDKIMELNQILDHVLRFFIGTPEVASNPEVAGPPAPENSPLFQLNQYQVEVFKLTIASIKDAVANYGNYLQAVNAVSYKENHDEDGRNVEQDKCKLAVQQQGLRSPMKGVNSDCK
jgi:hypothetical protein